MTVEERLTLLENRFNQLDKSAAFTLQKDLQIVAKTGVKIGTAASQKLGFFGLKPIIQPTGVAVTAAGIHAALTSLGIIKP